MATRAERRRKPTWKLLESSEKDLTSPSKTIKKQQSSQRKTKSRQTQNYTKGNAAKESNIKVASSKGKAKSAPLQLAEADTSVTRRGKGKGNKGKGKARKKQVQLPEEDILQALKKDRQERIKEEVELLPEGKVRELLCMAAERDPSILHRIEAESESQPGQPLPPPHHPDDIPSWCVCHHCRDMPTDVEKRCCRRTPLRCMSESREAATLVLDPLVLYIFRMYRADIFAIQNLNEGDLNRQNRHAAYRCFILWQYGKLRSGDRRVIPSCVVWKIRDTYPDPHSHYTGFARGRLG